MAEIKSTMEMVLERAARIASSSNDHKDSDALIKEGMRLGASYLKDDSFDLTGLLHSIPQEEKAAQLKGLTTTLLRNIVLPREDEQLGLSQKALQGILQVGNKNAELANVLQEMNGILGQYQGHKEQLRGQLEQQFAGQMEQMEANMEKQTGAPMKLEPSQHPKFNEEWQRLQMELNDQYTKALEQHKNLISALLLKG